MEKHDFNFARRSVEYASTINNPVYIVSQEREQKKSYQGGI